MRDSWAWLALFLLGAYHGINPGMGWLFAVALGLQEKSRRSVFKALLPLALGHAISIGLIVLLVNLAQASLPLQPLRIAAAAILVGTGLYRFFRASHPRWVGMQVGFRDLTLWSFLMASGHGAGLMLVPIILGWLPRDSGLHGHHTAARLFSGSATTILIGRRWLAPVGIHTMGYLLITSLVALLVYEKLGLALLRQAWFNLDLLWAIALVATGIFTLLV